MQMSGPSSFLITSAKGIVLRSLVSLHADAGGLGHRSLRVHIYKAVMSVVETPTTCIRDPHRKDQTSAGYKIGNTLLELAHPVS